MHKEKSISMVCPCEYPLVFVDDRYSERIEYISIPDEVFDEMGEIRKPEFEVVEEEGFDKNIHKYMAVLWKNPKDATTKKYDINDHIVVAGCDFPMSKKGKLRCAEKEIYVVLHPIDEWKEHHMIKVK